MPDLTANRDLAVESVGTPVGAIWGASNHEG